jgi:hypothetical protein
MSRAGPLWSFQSEVLWDEEVWIQDSSTPSARTNNPIQLNLIKLSLDQRRVLEIDHFT